MDNEKDLRSLSEESLAKGEDLNPEVFPHLGNLSAAFIYQFVYRPKKRTLPEFAYIPYDPDRHSEGNSDEDSPLAILGMVAGWNMLWESAHLRGDILRTKLPKKFRWISRFKNVNLYLLPDIAGKSKFEVFQPLYQLIPYSATPTIRRYQRRSRASDKRQKGTSSCRKPGGNCVSVAS